MNKNARRGLRLDMGGVRREQKSSGRELAIREVFDYFRGASIVENHTIDNVILQRCLSIDFVKKVGSIDDEAPHDEFRIFLSKIDEFPDTETPGGQFGISDVYDATKNKLGEYRKRTTRIKEGRLEGGRQCLGEFPFLNEPVRNFHTRGDKTRFLRGEIQKNGPNFFG